VDRQHVRMDFSWSKKFCELPNLKGRIGNIVNTKLSKETMTPNYLRKQVNLTCLTVSSVLNLFFSL
jgi:hypothetical protein